MPVGRPSDYTQDLADEICSQLSEGKSMRRVCESDDMPSKATVFNWLRTNNEFLDQYEKAKAEAADFLAEEIVEIADYSVNDLIVTLNIDLENKPKEEWTEHDVKLVAAKLNPENIQRSRLRVDARKWVASKLKPKKYGDKTELSGELHIPLSGTVKFRKVDEPVSDS